MISMEAWVTIRYLRAKGRSIKGIARELGISKNTVRRALRANNGESRQELILMLFNCF